MKVLILVLTTIFGTLSAQKPDCSNVSCLRVDPAECRKENGVYVKNKQDCCSQCIKNTVFPRRPVCPKITPEDCFKDYLAFVPKGKCNKCNECRPIEEVQEGEPMMCIPELCMNMNQPCEDHTIQDCKRNQVLIPKDGCQCCDRCATSKIKC